MSELAAHELVAVVNCKVHGCDEEAISARGRYAKLCELHRRDAQAAPPKRSLVQAAPLGPRPSLKEAAQRVVPAAAELDKALGRRAVVREQARQAFIVFKEALDELHAVAKEAVA